MTVALLAVAPAALAVPVGTTPDTRPATDERRGHLPAQDRLADTSLDMSHGNEWYQADSTRATPRAVLRNSYTWPVLPNVDLGVDAFYIPAVTDLSNFRLYGEAFAKIAITPDALSTNPPLPSRPSGPPSCGRRLVYWKGVWQAGASLRRPGGEDIHGGVDHRLRSRRLGAGTTPDRVAACSWPSGDDCRRHGP